ncbi:MAG: imidazole glycerol phosphate synthase subunit HisF [Bacteroidales bacterium]|nr:imidazole glycerol phosphate synthase subunit HisF [Candidatus Cacconaster merdequi]
MVAKRIIPCLDVNEGKTVKGVNFLNLREVGDPVELGAHYACGGADELVYLDISATFEGRRTFTALVERIADRINIPFTVGGGISELDDAARLLDSGADKISINSAAIARPELISEIADKYGSQFVVIAIDAKLSPDGRWMATTHGGRHLTDLDIFEWAHEAQERGAGELLLTSMEHDGARCGYPCDLFARINGLLKIPVIASGGAGTIDDIFDVLDKGHADAALAASIFHYGTYTIKEVKEELNRRNMKVRI